MDPKQIKAIFFDVDGTLISYKDHRIHPEDLESLRILHDKGIRLFIASGRDFGIQGEVLALEPIAPFMDGFIGINGQHCELADGTVVSSRFMDDEDFSAIRVCCAEHHFALLYYYGKETFVTEMTGLVRKFADYVRIAPPKVRSLAPDDPTPRKVCVYVTEADDRNYLQPLLKHTLTANNHDFLSDLIPVGVGKDSGIHDICTYFGFSRQETMAFGDGENDVSMLRYAGCGIAMGSASENVRSAADHVTGNAEEAGITQALKHFALL